MWEFPMISGVIVKLWEKLKLEAGLKTTTFTFKCLMQFCKWDNRCFRILHLAYIFLHYALLLELYSACPHGTILYCLSPIHCSMPVFNVTAPSSNPATEGYITTNSVPPFPVFIVRRALWEHCESIDMLLCEQRDIFPGGHSDHNNFTKPPSS